MIPMSNNRIYETKYNKYGSKMEIIAYRKAIDIDVYFEEYDYVAKTSYQSFKRGTVKSPYCRTVRGIGYLGEGKYSMCNNKIAYIHWSTLLQRCYDEKFRNEHKNYISSTVCEEWHNFQNFAEWFEENYYEIDGQRMEVENNILMKGNTEYCPEYSIISPQRINNLFVKCENTKDRGKYPIGVTWHKASNKYRGQCSYIDDCGNYKRISQQFDTEIEAFEFYKQFKENYIKQVADEYKHLIPRELYKAMYEYEIDIND
mgnify:CR=1 FL=1